MWPHNLKNQQHSYNCSLVMWLSFTQSHEMNPVFSFSNKGGLVWLSIWNESVSVLAVHQSLLQSDLGWQVQWACRRRNRHFALVHHGVYICNWRPLWNTVSLFHHHSAGKVRSNSFGKETYFPLLFFGLTLCGGAWLLCKLRLFHNIDTLLL